MTERTRRPDISILRGPAAVSVLDEVRPVWLALLAHHAELPDAPDALAPQDSWPRRRANYVEWLGLPDSFLALARQDERSVAYALVAVRSGGDDTWRTGDRIAEVETLSVLPECRGQGIGSQLLDAVDAELDRLGVADLQIAAVHSNTAAIRLYASRGLTPRLTVLSRYR